MKSVAGLVGALLVLNIVRLPAVVRGEGKERGPCWDSAMTQKSLNDCAAQDAYKADLEMGKVFDRALAKYAADPANVARIKKAQEAWLAFRDAEIDAYYAASDRRNHGSVWPMCKGLERARLTADRTRQLERIVDDEPEGDVCRD